MRILQHSLMSPLRLVSVLLLFVFIAPALVQAQSSFDLQFSDRALGALERSAEDGISPERFAEWMVEHGEVTLELEGVEGEISPQLMIAVFDGEGRKVQNDTPLRAVEGRHPLGDMVETREVERLVRRVITGEIRLDTVERSDEDLFISSGSGRTLAPSVHVADAFWTNRLIKIENDYIIFDTSWDRITEVEVGDLLWFQNSMYTPTIREVVAVNESAAEVFFLNNMYIPSDTLFSGSHFVSTSEDALRVVAEQSREASARQMECCSGKHDGATPHGIAVMILPESERFDQPVRPGGSLFIAWI